MVISFVEFLNESLDFSEWESRDGVQHNFKDSRGNEVGVYYNDRLQKGHYKLGFHVNHSYMMPLNAGLEAKHFVLRAVTKSLQRFTSKYKPKEISFIGTDSEKHAHWGNIAKLLAPQLGAKYSQGGEDQETRYFKQNSKHILTFPNG